MPLLPIEGPEIINRWSTRGLLALGILIDRIKQEIKTKVHREQHRIEEMKTD